MHTIRHAVSKDIPAIGEIVNGCAEYGLMLHRSLSFLYEHLRDFHVAVSQEDRVVGVCGLSVVWANLAEVYALAVSADCRRSGAGSALVKACMHEARQLGIRRLMALTYEADFFTKLGFAVVDRQSLPLKVWSECLRCSKNQACDEIAMVHVMDDVPEIAAPQPGQPVEGTYEVPVTLGLSGSKRPKMDEAH